MSKERRTVTLDPEVNDYLDREGVNASELVNRLVKRHMTAGDDDPQYLQLRAEQLRSDIKSLDSRKETKVDELDLVESRMEQAMDARVDVFDDAAEALTRDDLRAENQKVEWWADEAGVTVDRLVDEVADRLE